MYVRDVRNRNRCAMTGNQKFISVIRQTIFFITKPSSFKLYVCFLCPSNARVGYLLLKRENLDTYLTEVVDNEYRRLGIASQMIQFAIESIDLGGRAIVEIYNSNQASIKLHLSQGFVLDRVGPFTSIYVYNKCQVNS